MSEFKEYNGLKALKKARRDKALIEGMYDGRFSPKVLIDKKKKQDREQCRKFNLNFYN